MFAKNEKNPNATTSVPEPTPPEPKAPPSKISDMPSVISADLEVLGDLKSAGDIQVEGRVKGDIRSRSVSVMKGAVIEGSLYADTVNISGVVNGQVEAPQVSVYKNARVKGDIIHGTLAIESGAQFEGACRRLEAAKKQSGANPQSGQPVKAA